jgi:response regulator of citrate/malate metabolism
MLTYFKNPPVVLLTRDPALETMVRHVVSADEIDVPAMRFSSVATTPECLSAVQLLHPSVVLIDDAASDSTGTQLLHALQTVQPNVRVVYLASHHTLELEGELRRNGVLVYMARPVETEGLESALAIILQGLLRSST